MQKILVIVLVTTLLLSAVGCTRSNTGDIRIESTSGAVVKVAQTEPTIVPSVASTEPAETQATESEGSSQPNKSQPTESTPSEPTPSESIPTEPTPSEPEVTAPKATDPAATEPKPTEPKPTEPKETTLMPTDPQPTETIPAYPAPTDPSIKESHTHRYTSTVTKAATCTSVGILTYTCSCGSTYTESIAMLDHTFISEVTAPSCYTNGYTTHTCYYCGYSYTDNETPAAHNYYVEYVQEPTCEFYGYTHYTCSICGYSYDDDEVAAPGHKWSEWTLKFRNVYHGYEERTCLTCGSTDFNWNEDLKLSQQEIIQEVFRLVNIEREKAGVAPLQYYTECQEAADIRAHELTQYYSHTRPDGRACITVFYDLYGTYSICGENIAGGYVTPESVVTAWMNSEGHRANILNPSHTYIIVGYENGYWVQLFI